MTKISGKYRKNLDEPVSLWMRRICSTRSRLSPFGVVDISAHRSTDEWCRWRSAVPFRSAVLFLRRMLRPILTDMRQTLFCVSRDKHNREMFYLRRHRWSIEPVRGVEGFSKYFWRSVTTRLSTTSFMSKRRFWTQKRLEGEVRSDCREEDSAQWMNDRSRRERNECLISSSRDLSVSSGVRWKLGFFCTSRMAFGNSCSGTFDRQFVGVSTADMNEIPKEQCDIPLRTQRFLQNLNTTIDRSTNGFPASFEFHWPRWWLDKDPKDLFHPRQSTIELCHNDIAVHRATGLSKRNPSAVLEIVSEKRTVRLNKFQFACQRQRRHFEVRRQLFEDVLFLIFYAQLEIDLHFGVCRWFQRRMEMSFDRRETLLRAERVFELDFCEDLVRLDIDWREDLRDEDAHWPHVCRRVTTVEPKNITDTVERSVVHWRRKSFVEELARSCLVLWCFGMFVSRRDDSIEDCPAK